MPWASPSSASAAARHIRSSSISPLAQIWTVTGSALCRKQNKIHQEFPLWSLKHLIPRPYPKHHRQHGANTLAQTTQSKSSSPTASRRRPDGRPADTCRSTAPPRPPRTCSTFRQRLPTRTSHPHPSASASGQYCLYQNRKYLPDNK